MVETGKPELVALSDGNGDERLEPGATGIDGVGDT
jgi:hypothetical protein